MPEYFLRTIKQGYVTLFEKVKSSGEFHDHPAYEWVPPGQLPADLLSSFETKKGEISLYKIEDKDDTQLCLSILSSIYGGEARGGADYIIIDLSFLDDIDIAMPRQTRGSTRIKWVNKLHFDLIHLTIDNIVMLVRNLPEILVDSDSFANDEIFEKFQELTNQQSSK